MEGRKFSMPVSVVIPTYNEGTRLVNTVNQLIPTGYNIIIVDDGSKDNTAELVASLPVHFLAHSVNCGQGAALKTGTEYAKMLGSDIIAHFDADGQHRVEDLVKLVSFLQSNQHDIVLGSRFLDNKTQFPLHKKIILNIAKIFSQQLIGLNFSDPQSGLRAFKTKALQSLDWQKNDFLHCTEILTLIIKNKLCYEELPIIVNYNLAEKKATRPRISMGFRIIIHKLFN